MTEKRHITEAAIKTEDGTVYSCPRPLRHDAVIAFIYQETGEPIRNEIQGFLDSEGNFVDRREAERIAHEAGQLVRPMIGGVLTSEDLWDSWRCGYDVNEKRVVGGCGATYERPKRKPLRRGQRVNRKRTTTCPNCGQVDALHPKKI